MALAHPFSPSIQTPCDGVCVDDGAGRPTSLTVSERLRINIIETKSWLSSYINMLPYCVKRKPLKQQAFQIGTFGTVVTTRPFARALIVAPNWIATIPDFRADMGRGVLLGLELLVAADIVGTVAIAPRSTVSACSQS